MTYDDDDDVVDDDHDDDDDNVSVAWTDIFHYYRVFMCLLGPADCMHSVA